MAAEIREIQHFSEPLHVISIVPTGFKICTWWENDFWEKSPVGEYVFFLFIYFFIFTQKFKISHRSRYKCVFFNLTQKFKMAAKNVGKAIFVKCCQNRSISHRFQDKCVFAFYAEIQDGCQK